MPVSAENSRTLDDNEDMYAVHHSIDLDLKTLSGAEPGSDGANWLKLTLDQVYCVEQVIWIGRKDKPFFTWTCSMTNCSTCDHDRGNNSYSRCRDFTTTVYTEGANTQNTSSSCKYGDRVKIERNGSLLVIAEIAITGRQGKHYFVHTLH